MMTVFQTKQIKGILFLVFLQVWPHSEFPMIPVGRIVLNRNPRNYFAEVEQSAFSPAHLIPGIEPSPDKMFQVCILYVWHRMLQFIFCLIKFINIDRDALNI